MDTELITIVISLFFIMLSLRIIRNRTQLIEQLMLTTVAIVILAPTLPALTLNTIQFRVAITGMLIPAIALLTGIGYRAWEQE